MNKKRFAKGSVVLQPFKHPNFGDIYDIVKIKDEIKGSFVKLPVEVIARTCAPPEAVEAVVKHYQGHAIVYYKNKYVNDIGLNFAGGYRQIYFIYGPADETPEQTIPIEWIEE